ncbi:MAG: trypsin-like peptidase domain-containing protein [Oligoflexia bacterium]|nr:trypsin-like peptidase domain-containing protein [Oligoflexia bacterium]
MIFNKWKILAATSICLIIGQAWSSEDAQREFEKAKFYTIKIRSSVDIPFDNNSKGTSTGAGFLIDKQRKWAVTNAHVVSRSKAIIQTSSFGTEFKLAKPVYIDPDYDIAVIQLENVDGLNEASLECSHSAFIGLSVGAFGHPWDHSYTGTKGIVSGRTSELSNTFGDFLQTDAPINPGNSGGPLINLKTGKIIGINTAGLTEAQNMNYAVPSDEICSVVKLLKLGINPNPPDVPFSFFKDSDDKNTLKISETMEAGKKLNAKIGDIIFAAGKDKTLVKNEAQLRNALRGQVDAAMLYVMREGKEIILKGPITPLPSVLSRRGVYFSGLLIGKNEDKTFREVFGSEPVLKVNYADAGGIGESRGIKSEDILVSIEGKKINDIDELYRELALIKKTKNSAVVQFKRLSFEKGHIFTYRERTLPISEIGWVQFDNNLQTMRLAEVKR